MTPEEFNRCCAEVMEYELRLELGYICIPAPDGSCWIKYDPHSDMNQLAEVFDRLWAEQEEWKNTDEDGMPLFPVDDEKGIRQAMIDFIWSTKE